MGQHVSAVVRSMQRDKQPTAFLTAQWRNVILLTYAVPPGVLTPLLPPGCELDLISGRAFVSLVAFDFLRTRVLKIAWPGHVNFPEVNLRFYVRHGQDRGVAFVREFVPRRMVAALARLIYNEPYRGAPMRSRVEKVGDGIVVTHRLRLHGREYTIRISADAAAHLPSSHGSDHFFKEHMWGFGTSRSGQLLRYRVEHPPWEVHPVRSVNLDWDWHAIYGPRWSFLEEQQPYSVMLAEGSSVSVSPKISRVA